LIKKLRRVNQYCALLPDIRGSQQRPWSGRMKENGQNKWPLLDMKTISIPARGKGNFDPKIGGLKPKK
jgi:hypothetical protein